MPLKLTLAPGERFFVNGAELQNGNRRAHIILQSKARVLKGNMLEIDVVEDSSPSVAVFVSLRDAYMRGEAFAPELMQALEALCDERELALDHQLRRALVRAQDDPYGVVRTLHRLLWTKGILNE